MRVSQFRWIEFESLPEQLEPATLYVSQERDLAAHLCACGCGKEVVTPLSSAGWSFELRGARASLYPSIGNWALPCRSHYFIRDGAVLWARDMSEEAIANGRRRDRARKARYYAATSPREDMRPPRKASGWTRLREWARRWLS